MNYSIILYLIASAFAFSGNTAAADTEIEQQNLPLGRLFLTPAERQQLDQLRQSGSDGTENSAPSIAPDNVMTSALLPQPPIHLSGVLFRADGEYMVWINGKSALSAEQPEIHVDARRIRPGITRIPLQQNGQEIQLKPGQVWLPEERKTIEAYTLNDDSTSTDATPSEHQQP